METYKFAFSNSSPEEADVLVFGLPIKGSSTEKTPEEVRKESYKIYSQIYGKLPAKISDLGNLDINDVKKIKKPFLMIGGNHLSTYYALQSDFVRRKVKNVLIFDSHPDCFGDELNHASFVKFLLDKFKVTIVGISNPAKEEIKFMDENDIIWFSSKDVFWNYEDVMKNIPNKAYVSIDMDVFLMNSGSYQSELLGLLPHQVFRLIEDIEVVSGDVVEALPEGAIHAARTVVEMIGLIGKHL